MSKAEMARALSDSASAQQLQIVQAIQQLQQSMAALQSLPEQTASSTKQALEQVRQQIDQMQRELATLPEAVASETSQALRGLETLRQDVTAVLKAYDQVTAHQRQSLDELTKEMTSKASQAFEAKAQSLHAPLGALEAKAQDLSTSIQKLTGTASQIAGLPQRLTTAAGSMTSAASTLNTSARALQEAAESLRPPLWKRLGTVAAVAVLAGAAGAMLPETGRAALSRLLPPAAEQQELATFRAMWRKATPKERESMQEIARRPAN